MTLAEWLRTRTAEWRALGEAVQSVGGRELTLTVRVAGNDRAEAEAIKRGQRPEMLAALRNALK